MDMYDDDMQFGPDPQIEARASVILADLKARPDIEKQVHDMLDPEQRLRRSVPAAETLLKQAVKMSAYGIAEREIEIKHFHTPDQLATAFARQLQMDRFALQQERPKGVSLN